MPGGVGLGALVNLPARPFVPVAAGSADSHDSPGAVPAAVPVVRVVGDQFHRVSLGVELGTKVGGEVAVVETGGGELSHRRARASCRRHRKPGPGSG